MPITATGYQRRTLDEVLTSIQEFLRGKISKKLALTERTVLGNVSNLDADHIDQLEQLIEEAYNAFDPDNASDDRFVALSLLTGVPRRGPSAGLVVVTLDLDASQDYSAEQLQLAVEDEPENTWRNRDAFASTSAGTYFVVFKSELLSSAARAEAGTLTVIASDPVGGVNSATNAADATPGQDIESIAALRIRREQALSIGGSRTRGAIRSKLILLDGVLSAEVFDNKTNVTDANGLPPKSLRAVIWDGSPAQANNDAIAQVIHDHSAEGILADGTVTGLAQDAVLGPQTIAFSRATPSNATVAVQIQSAAGVSAEDVKSAILAKMPNRVGAEVTFNRLAGAVFSVPGVDDWVSFTINGGTADLPAIQSVIYLLDASSITVTGDVS